MKQQVKVMCIYLDGRSDNILLALFNATLFYVGRTICFSLDLFLMIFSLLFFAVVHVKFQDLFFARHKNISGRISHDFKHLHTQNANIKKKKDGQQQKKK